ncbi:CDP-6-deoxy-delta-3,4-glucoseen reductase [Thiopseudomonas acetoxidans]|uniref:CDP-6-deoxy-delta-3,4-glucoseen reductase n=1 Tax=Thiopseudomonas acetoxidans TaxID=3041622 RepID=A0ABT7SN05_9GAMM|nr:CDP-6-deoxy-delta-3,4-glucoseen reductase [Thiopseudomonas sp. CY1220]MDM7857577.1 CDP-6-deoxy-delta-3,4-glucoseen reductase [Thiopseudomonas sp. CY1220]
MDNKPIQTIACAVQSIQDLGANVYQLKLLLPQSANVNHAAGQYLMLAAQQGDFYPFSIASAPQQLPELELHILAHDNAAVDLIEQLKEQPEARVQLPMGDVCLTDLDERPLLLIAAGTGLAQMHSMLEHCRQQNAQMPIHLYWGAKTEEDFYSVPAVALWRKMPNVQLHKIVSHDADWNGRSGLLYEAVCHDLADLKNFRVFVSGSPNMVYATHDALVKCGMQAEQIQADVFSYAPRP